MHYDKLKILNSPIVPLFECSLELHAGKVLLNLNDGFND